MRYFIEISYNGGAYHGWQVQPNAITVQDVLERALSHILGEPITIVGAGRTDTGVHAKQMFAHFDTDVSFTANIVYKLNAYLPKDISIVDVFEVKSDAHARFDALSRTYLYRIALKKNVFDFDFTYYMKQALDVNRMQVASKVLFGYNDFQCFSKSNTDVKTYNCKIMQCDWQLVEDELQLTITADRFLRNMVRAIVGTLINIGLGKITLEDLKNIIESKNRSEAGYSVPAHALYLVSVTYPQDLRI